MQANISPKSSVYFLQFHAPSIIVGIESDKPEDISDIEKLLHPPEPILSAHLKMGRNELCYCGSGKKHKKCCLEGIT